MADNLDDSLSAKRKQGMFSNVPSRVKWIIYSSSFTGVAGGYAIVYVTGYLPQQGFSSSIVGLLLGVFGIVPIVLGIPIGILSDRRGRKWLLILGSIAIPIGLFVFGLTSSVAYLLLSSVIFGLGEAASLTTWNAIIADQTTEENRDAAFSLSFVLSNVSTGLGFAIPLSFPELETILGIGSQTIHRDFILGLSVLSLLTPIMLVILLKGYLEKVPMRKNPNKLPPVLRESYGTLGSENELEIRKLRRRKNLRFLLKFSIVNGLIGLGAGFIIPLIPTWLYLKFAVSDVYSGPLLAISNITIGFAGFVSPRLSKKYGLVNAVTMTEGLSTIFMVSLALIPNVYLASSLYIIRAALMNMASPLADSFVMTGISTEDRGLASAINSIIWRLPNSASTIVGGVILQMRIFDLPFYLAGILYIVSVSSFYFLFRNTGVRTST